MSKFQVQIGCLTMSIYQLATSCSIEVDQIWIRQPSCALGPGKLIDADKLFCIGISPYRLIGYNQIIKLFISVISTSNHKIINVRFFYIKNILSYINRQLQVIHDPSHYWRMQDFAMGRFRPFLFPQSFLQFLFFYFFFFVPTFFPVLL